MKSLAASVQSFMQLVGGKSLKNLRTFNKEKQLHKFQMSKYLEYLDTQNLNAIAALPCPNTEKNLNLSNINLSKMMRNSLNISESSACEKCQHKSTCPQYKVVIKIKPTVADLSKFIYARCNDLPTGEDEQKSLINVLESFPSFISNIEKYPVLLKKINTIKDEPIKAEKIKAKVFKKPPKIHKKFQYSPESKEIAKQAKLERRRERQKLDKEIDLLVKRTTIKVKKDIRKGGKIIMRGNKKI